MRAMNLTVGCCQNYDSGVDMWAIGCIFAEMAAGEPLFQGTSDADQIRIIVSCLGQVLY